MKVKIGEYELLDSITLIGIDDKPIEVQLGENDEGSGEVALTYVFSFKKDEDNKESRIAYRIDNNTKGFIDFYNLSTYFGGGNTKIVRIGTYKGRELFYNVRIFSLEKASNTIIINFYRGKEVNNAQ